MGAAKVTLRGPICYSEVTSPLQRCPHGGIRFRGRGPRALLLRSMKPSAVLLLLVACGSPERAVQGDDAPPIDARPGVDGSLVDGPLVDGPLAVDAAPQAKVIRTVFVIPFENKASSQIYGNTDDAPYINSLLTSTAAHTTQFGDALPSLPSEPHYVLMEAGTNTFNDRTFTNDDDPSSASNSTAQHRAPRLPAQHGRQSRGCPTRKASRATRARYRFGRALRREAQRPFVFFQDIAGNPPGATTPGCASTTRPTPTSPATSRPA